MNAPRPASWFALSGDTGAKGEPMAGKHAAPLRDFWATQQEAMQPLLKFSGVPYQDNESTGTVLNESGRQLERDVTAALRMSRHTIPQLDAELTAIVADLQTRNARSATELRLVMLTGLLIAIVLGVLVATLLIARQRQETCCAKRASRPRTSCAPSKTACFCWIRIWSSVRLIPARSSRCSSARISRACRSRVC